MAKPFVFFIFLLSICNISCSSDHPSDGSGYTPEGPPVKRNDLIGVTHQFKGFETGKSINHIPCLHDSNETFCLYLPKDYDTLKSWPVIYFFDAHARGKLPIKKYQELAEKYGMIFIGSNNSQNSLKPEVYDKIINDLFRTTQTFLNIDDKRITVSGFSGGAKVAGAAAIKLGNIISVIGCAAPMDASRIGGSYFNYAGIVGKGDFNYWDMVALDNAFGKTPLKHQLFTFEGIHEWPDKETFSKAVLFTIQASKNEKTETGDKIDPAIQEKEQSLKESYGKDFQTQSPEYLISEINKLYNGFKNDKNQEEKWMDRRLLSFISIMSFLKTSQLLNSNHLDDAATYLRVFKACDPKNPDGPYLAADYYVLMGQKDKAVAALNEAMKLGFDDLANFSTDPKMNSLKSDPGYERIYRLLSN